MSEPLHVGRGRSFDDYPHDVRFPRKRTWLGDLWVSGPLRAGGSPPRCAILDQRRDAREGPTAAQGLAGTLRLRL